MAETATKNEQPAPTQADWTILSQHLKRANDGDESSIRWLREFLGRHPHVWQRLGDLANAAERAWIALIANGDALTVESVKLQLTHLKTQLVGATPSPIEKLLGDTVVATWLEVRHLESVSASPHVGGGMLGQAALLLKRLESAQRRHMNALKSLTQIRKLLPNRETVQPLRIFDGERATG